jgi:hypothetical protein
MMLEGEVLTLQSFTVFSVPPPILRMQNLQAAQLLPVDMQLAGEFTSQQEHRFDARPLRRGTLMCFAADVGNCLFRSVTLSAQGASIISPRRPGIVRCCSRHRREPAPLAALQVEVSPSSAFFLCFTFMSIRDSIKHAGLFPVIKSHTHSTNQRCVSCCHVGAACSDRSIFHPPQPGSQYLKIT